MDQPVIQFAGAMQVVCMAALELDMKMHLQVQKQ
jgi:hypothetical protein